MVSDFNAGRTAAAFLFPPLVSWPRIIKRHSYGVPERFVDNAGSWLAGNYLSVQYLLFADASAYRYEVYVRISPIMSTNCRTFSLIDLQS